MRQLFVMFAVISGLSYTYADENNPIAQVDHGRSLTAPSETLAENDCIFKNKSIIALQEHTYIVDKCDRRYTTALILIGDHLPEGACVYNLVQKMSGHTIARVVEKCPTIVNQDIQGIVPDAPLEELNHMPPGPAEKLIKKVASKPKSNPQQEPAPASPKKKDQPKPKTNEQVEKGKEGYYLNPDEIEF